MLALWRQALDGERTEFGILIAVVPALGIGPWTTALCGSSKDRHFCSHSDGRETPARLPLVRACAFGRVFLLVSVGIGDVDRHPRSAGYEEFKEFNRRGSDTPRPSK